MSKKETKKFNYAVGFYWEGNDGIISTYAHGKEVFFGTIKEAQSFRDYCQIRSDSVNEGKNKQTYKIFKLVEISE